ncbi:hypothetical protein BPT24_183 [Tenacibaculum phage pT24]|uniref:Uncharacterized protein n=1 Tax=Tenacibaculum phage pT24 TaxID=1880590 RepID=A0A1B4XWY8_9CAUD|nr:hypothetical protein HYP10_gp183 [Tenacibaculum phage pT24]BAV39308.1 hypothetical protein BPT24_183 [Tenacibaculum phage pT24]
MKHIDIKEYLTNVFESKGDWEKEVDSCEDGSCDAKNKEERKKERAKNLGYAEKELDKEKKDAEKEEKEKEKGNEENDINTLGTDNDGEGEKDNFEIDGVQVDFDDE